MAIKGIASEVLQRQDKDGMPVGMQLLGQTFDEKSIIRAAYAFECTKTYKRPDALGTVEAERGLA